jgi:spore germination protein GerM
MAPKGKKRGQRRSQKSSSGGSFFLILILIGIGVAAFVLFRQDIMNALKPGTEKKAVQKEKKNVLLYFSDEDGDYLVGEKRDILRKGRVEDEAKEVVEELTKGPKGKLVPTLPSQTRLLALRLGEGGIARVDFNSAISKNHPGGSSAEIMTVYSVVNSLTGNFPEIKKVQILIEGNEIDTIKGHLSLKRPIPPNPALVKKPAKN